MIWIVAALFAAIVYVAWSHDRHINRLYRQIADLERRLRDAEPGLEQPPPAG